MPVTIILLFALSLFGVAVAFFYVGKVKKVPLTLGLEGEKAEKLTYIHGAIAEGAMAFLKQEYKFLSVFMVIFAIIIALAVDDHETQGVRDGVYTAVAFLFGAARSSARYTDGSMDGGSRPG